MLFFFKIRKPSKLVVFLSYFALFFKELNIARKVLYFSVLTSVPVQKKKEKSSTKPGAYSEVHINRVKLLEFMFGSILCKSFNTPFPTSNPILALQRILSILNVNTQNLTKYRPLKSCSQINSAVSLPSGRLALKVALDKKAPT